MQKKSSIASVTSTGSILKDNQRKTIKKGFSMLTAVKNAYGVNTIKNNDLTAKKVATFKPRKSVMITSKSGKIKSRPNMKFTKTN